MKSVWLLVGVLCVVFPKIAWAGDPCDPCGGNCGEVIGTLRDVDAFSNGARGNCTGTGRGFYQCVEYAKRYNGRAGERWGNANQIFGRATRLGLRSFRNGETEAPQQGDAITFKGGRYGHIAIIYEVGSDFITLIEQNWHNIPGHFRRLEMDVDGGRYTVVSDSRIYTVEGWLRPDIDPTLTDDDGDTVSESEGDCDDGNADIHPGAAELCNGADENCDGEIDETWPELDSACTVRLTPYCTRDGIWICEPFHRGTVCGADYTTYPETCNGIDDDCDGQTDEDWRTGSPADLGEPCEVGFGVCRRSGVWACEPLHRGTVCDAEYVSGTPEVCGDGLDNDCDETVDEGCCPAGLTDCGGSCVSLRNNPSHCGYCFHSCTGAYACIGTDCVYGCPGSLTLCSGVCVDLRSNPSHCGTCTHVCSSGVCRDWVCR